MRFRPPTARLGALVAADGLFAGSCAAAGAEIGRTLDLEIGAVLALLALFWWAAAAGGFAWAHVVAARPVRARAVRLAAIVAALSAAALAVVTGPWGLAGVLAVAGLARGAAHALHPSLIADAADPRQMVRAVVAYRGFALVGFAAGPALVASAYGLGLTWRAVALGAAAAGLVGVALCLRLAEPPLAPGGPRLGGIEGAGRLLRLPSAPWLLLAGGVATGIATSPVPFLLFILEDRWQMTLREGAGALAAVAIGAALLLAIFVGDADRRFARGAEGLVRVAIGAVTAGAVMFAAGVFLAPWALIPVMAAALACLVLVQSWTLAIALAVVPPELRPHAGALGGAFAALAAAGPALSLVSLTEETGPLAALAGGALGAVPAVAFLLVAAGRVRDDEREMAVVLAERHALMEQAARGDVPPLLECRGLVFGYDERRVLDEAELRAEAGEVVAVLGTNGAGKSTLLKAVSGLVLAQRGSVRVDGLDVTHFDAERRSALGVLHVVGGAATFGPLTVIDSLRLAAHADGLRGSSREAAARRALESLPSLRERERVPVEALSGGERHLLGLAQTLVRRPRLLLIDELTMSLGPAARDDVRSLVAEAAARGTAVVVVDQSVDVALALASRAYFLDQGRVVFHGAPSELRERADLLRSVFLAHALEGTG